jgi:hypothetical protein
MIRSASLPLTYRRIVITAVLATSGATFALILIALVLPARAALALHWYLVVIGAIVVVAAIRAFTVRYPVRWQSPRDPFPRLRAAPPEIPARLRTIDRLVSRSRWDPVGFHLELRPILRAIATQRLATYRMIDMESDPDTARAVLGERVWTFLIPVDLGPGRGDRTVDLADVRATVETLEKLHDRDISDD